MLLDPVLCLLVCRVRVHVFVPMRVCVCMCVCADACVRVFLCVRALCARACALMPIFQTPLKVVKGVKGG